MAKKTFPDEPDERPVTPNRPEIERPGDPGRPDIPQEDPQREPAEIPPTVPPMPTPHPDPGPAPQPGPQGVVLVVKIEPPAAIQDYLLRS